MKQPPAYSAWDRISLEIASRAFTYAQCADSARKAEARSGYLKFSNLEALHELRQPPKDKDAWWWNFTPLLKALLAGKESPALLVALGHHTWVGGSTGYRREWLGFLAQDLEAPQNFDTLLDICNFTALHTSCSRFAQEDVLLTSRLLELVNKQGDGGKRPNQSSEWPVLQPLLCRFAEHRKGTDDESWPVLVADWRDLMVSASTITKQIRPPQKDLYPITPQELKTALADDSNFDTPRIPCEFGPSAAAAADKFYLHYKGILNERLTAILRMHPVQDLDRMLFGSDNPRNLLPWVAKLPGGLDAYREKMLRTVLWFHDFAGDSLSLGKPRTHFLLSSPLWLPENVQGVATVSMVAYLRDHAFAVAPTAESAAIVNAFRSGSTVVLKNIGKVSGIEVGFKQAEIDLSHELDLFVGTVDALIQTVERETDVDTTEAKLGSQYIDTYRRVLGFKLGEGMPEILAKAFTNELLSEFTFRLAYRRASTRGWIPEKPDGTRWSPDELWVTHKSWIDCQIELPAWISPDRLHGRHYDPKASYVGFWLFFLLIGAQAHSIDYAFPMNVRDIWDGKEIGAERARITLSPRQADSGWEIIIENLGTQSSSHPDPLRGSSKTIIESFAARTVGDWSVSMEHFALQPPNRWRARINVSPQRKAL